MGLAYASFGTKYRTGIFSLAMIYLYSECIGNVHCGHHHGVDKFRRNVLGIICGIVFYIRYLLKNISFTYVKLFQNQMNVWSKLVLVFTDKSQTDNNYVVMYARLLFTYLHLKTSS